MGAGDVEKLRLFLILPFKIADEFQIRDLHPEIASVFLPRQKSRRWCLVNCATKEALQAVSKHLKALKIEGKRIRVKPYRGKKAKPAPKLEQFSVEPPLHLLD